MAGDVNWPDREYGRCKVFVGQNPNRSWRTEILSPRFHLSGQKDYLTLGELLRLRDSIDEVLGWLEGQRELL